MGAVEIIALIAALVSASRGIMEDLGEVVDLYKKMNDEKRTTLTPEEEAKIIAVNDAARARFKATIDKMPQAAILASPDKTPIKIIDKV